MKQPQLIVAFGAMLSAFLTVSSHAALIGVLPTIPGGTDWQAYYDPELDVTWATIVNITGNGTWDNQVASVAALTIGGIGGWRLPNADVNGDGTVVDCTNGSVPAPAECNDNELGFLFYRNSVSNILSPGGVDLFRTTPGSGLFVGSWTSTPLSSDPNSIVVFDLTRGLQFSTPKGATISVWAVHSGSVVPLPAAMWLFGTGLVALIGIARKKSA